MTSPRQRAANRRNARAGTGPRTPRGKGKARKNALRHGLAVPRDCALPELEELADAFRGPHEEDTAHAASARIAAEAQHHLMLVAAVRARLVVELSHNVCDLSGTAPERLARDLLRLERYTRRAASRRNRALRSLV